VQRARKSCQHLAGKPKICYTYQKGCGAAAALPERFRLLEGTQKEGEEHNVQA
jgi:hypothetical protein